MVYGVTGQNGTNGFADWTVKYDVDDGNFGGGIMSVFSPILPGNSNPGSGIQVGFSPTIPKTDHETLTFGFEYTWSRH